MQGCMMLDQVLDFLKCSSISVWVNYHKQPVLGRGQIDMCTHAHMLCNPVVLKCIGMQIQVAMIVKLYLSVGTPDFSLCGLNMR